MHAALTARLRRHLPFGHLQRQRLADVPSMELYLLNPDIPQHTLTPEQLQAVLDYPAYWAFCWASGQVLARYILDRPERVAGKRVLDFGAGSGVVGIAAAIAGAVEVVTCDTDPDALRAAAANAELNDVQLTPAADWSACTGSFDLIVAADVLYDRENLRWLDVFLGRAPGALVADSRIRDFDHPRYRRLGTWASSTWPDLDESAEFRSVSVYLGER